MLLGKGVESQPPPGGPPLRLEGYSYFIFVIIIIDIIIAIAIATI